MTAQFPDLPGRIQPKRASRPDWPRLMGEADAADYLSIGTTMLRDLLPPKKIRGRSLWDRHDLDRFADAVGGQPLDDGDAQSHARDVERRFLEQRGQKKQD